MTKDKVRCRVKALHGIAERVLASGFFLPTAVYLQIDYVSNLQFGAFTSCFSFLSENDSYSEKDQAKS